jgi:hypothetical protein
MATPIQQALVAIGGQATRLKNDGIDVPVSKSFLPVAGQPLLYWTLSSLHRAGIRSIVISGNETRFLYLAEQVVVSLPFTFEEVVYFQDGGLGVHGLPYKIKHLLDAQILFECGHHVSRPEHYQALAQAKTSTNVVFSAIVPHPKNPRYPVRLKQRTIEPVDQLGPEIYALAHPLVADQSYSLQLLDSSFSVKNIINHYAALGQLAWVKSDLPPEFDIALEFQDAQSAYEPYIKALFHLANPPSMNKP